MAFWNTCISDNDRWESVEPKKRKPDDKAPTGTTDVAVEMLVHAKKMWTDISPVCTTETTPGDEWNTYLMWRGFKMAMLTQGVKEVAVTYRREVNPPTLRLSGVSMLDDEYGQETYGKFCGEVAYVEAMLRQWPTVLPDAAGNFRLMVDKGEYGRVEVGNDEIKYARVTSYSDKEKRGRWGYVDSREMMAFTLKITGQIDTKDEKGSERELDSLMEL